MLKHFFSESSLTTFLNSKNITLSKSKIFRWSGIKIYSNPNFNPTSKTLKEKYKDDKNIVVNYFKSMIKSNADWYKHVKKDAIKQGISSDSSLYNNAIWFMKNSGN